MSNISKKMILIFSMILILIGFLFSIDLKTFNIKDSKAIKVLNEKDKNDIKNVVESFVKEDFNFNGGKNIFSTVGSDDFKKYLKARNDLKQLNNNKQGYKVLNSKYNFNFKNITNNDDVVKVNVYVSEIFSYDLNGKVEPDASAGNDYDIYLSKIDGYWKIMSATINAKVDPIDSFFDVNKELGYFNGKRQKNINISKNLEKMLKKISQETQKTINYYK